MYSSSTLLFDYVWGSILRCAPSLTLTSPKIASVINITASLLSYSPLFPPNHSAATPSVFLCLRWLYYIYPHFNFYKDRQCQFYYSLTVIKFSVIAPKSLYGARSAFLCLRWLHCIPPLMSSNIASGIAIIASLLLYLPSSPPYYHVFSYSPWLCRIYVIIIIISSSSSSRNNSIRQSPSCYSLLDAIDTYPQWYL